MTDTLASLARDMERTLLADQHKPFSHRATVLHLANLYAVVGLLAEVVERLLPMEEVK